MMINFKIYLQSSSKTVADRGKKRGRWKLQKFEYLENEKRFMDEIKSIIFKGYHLVKKLKIVGRNFKMKIYVSFLEMNFN